MKRTYCHDCLGLVGRKATVCAGCQTSRPTAGWPDDPLIGTAVGGKYRVLRRLGAGAIGVIYLAVHVELEARRALKVLDARLAHDKRIRGRFEREARALYRLNPRHIVRLEDFGEIRPGLPFMALEYVEGATLDDVLSSTGPLEPRRALRLARQIAVALVDAAEEGVLHRDLRPENVVLREHPLRGDEIKVLDFGIAKILGERTATRSGATTRGTLLRPEYVAPEQWMSDAPADARGDLFSLGVLLFELLTGETPWPVDRAEPFEVMRRMREETPRRLDALCADLPSGVTELVERLLAVEPAARPASARELVADIDRLGLLTTSVFDVVVDASHDELEDFDESFDEDADTRRVDVDDTRDLAGAATIEAGSRRRLRQAATVAEPPPFDRGASTVHGASALRPQERPPRSGHWLTLLAVVLALTAAALAAYALLGELPQRGENAPLDVRGNPSDSVDTTVDAGPAGAEGGAARRESLAQPPADMVRVAGGSVSIGPSERDQTAQRDQFPGVAGTWGFGSVRSYTVESFYIDRHEVALGDFVAWRSALSGDGDLPCGDDAWRSLPPDDPLAPIRGVSYDEARAYCEALGRRLPSFEEWEAAARGPQNRSLPWPGGWEVRGAFNTGSDDQPLYGVATSDADGYLGLAPVTALGASDWGVVGLGGNVSEWVSGPAPREDGAPYFHRGGSYLGHPVFSQSFAYQFVADRCTSWPTVGFRCASDGAWERQAPPGPW